MWNMYPAEPHCTYMSHTGGLPKGGGSHSGFARFFLFLLVAGIATIGFGVWWSQVTVMIGLNRAAPWLTCAGPSAAVLFAYEDISSYSTCLPLKRRQCHVQYAGDGVKARIEEIVGPAFEAVVGVIGSLILWCREKFSGAPWQLNFDALFCHQQRAALRDA